MLKSIFIFIATVCISFSCFTQEEWVLKKNTNNIKIYTRHQKDFAFDEYKATTLVNTPINDVLTELLDAPKYYENCPSGISHYIKPIGGNKHVFYAHKEFPWPIKNRDIVTLLTVKKISDKKIKLTLESLPNEIPKKDKTIRIKILMGHWLLEESNDEKTKITQQLFLDPEGSLPPFIVNTLLIKGPYRTFSQLHYINKKAS
ncbi:hypothetical protein A8C32_12860 [Flavivirga aquatica]|uniref:START domain-containing protein n=1 Tax=Flavivirga aquatica TaxID=1849968 RepID=A0A1E5TE13_9FLAO|nr:START domain-containing protein [Flavivirga aquatica]OEK09588.1 hypothetical protein A8C32_12860 [Flavivirga aquatica]